MSRSKFIRFATGGLVVIMFLFQLGCQKNDLQGRIDFYIDLTNGNVTSLDGSSQGQVQNYQNLNNLGGEVYVNGLIVFRGVDYTYNALSEYCPNDGCDVEYQVAFNRLQCLCDATHQFNIDGSFLMGPAQLSLYHYAASLSGTLLHIYTP